MLFVANSQKAESDADGINLVVRCQIIKLPVLVDLGCRLLLEVLVRVSNRVKVILFPHSSQNCADIPPTTRGGPALGGSCPSANPQEFLAG